MHEKRKRVWIDRFQTLLFWRVAFYFVFYQAAVWFLVAIENRIWTVVGDALGRETAASMMIFLIAIVIFIGVLFICDAVRFTHRIVGPLVRFRKAIQAIRDGDEVDLVQLRKGDMLHELKDEFNEMLQTLERRGAVAIKTPEDHHEPAGKN